ncbi:MAG: UDP-N-acetylmuramate dehydrogenase [Planctomycetota bacterium]
MSTRSPAGCTAGFSPRFDEKLADKTSFGLGGAAAAFAECRSVDEVRRTREYARERGLAFYVLGRGTNLLVRDEGVAGVVVRLAGREFTRARFDGTSVQAGAAIALPRLLGLAARRGLSGLAPLTGIPGSLGGALRMNAGTASGAIGDVVTEVTVLDASDAVRRLSREEAGFGYRTSALGEHVILGASLDLARSSPEAVRGEMREYRERRRGQPTRGRCAGCVFRNPPGEAAGALIDRCGLKGERIGGAYVSRRHANYILADGSATAGEVLTLIERVRERVLEKTGVKLELEICVWPSHPRDGG